MRHELIVAVSLPSSSLITNFIQSTKAGGDSFRNDVIAAVAVAAVGYEVYGDFLLQMVADQGDALNIANELLKRADKYGESLGFASAVYESVMNRNDRLTYTQGASIMGCSDKTYKNKHAIPVARESDDIMIKMSKVIYRICDLLK